MGRLFFMGSLSGVAIAAIARPWLGIVAAYFIAILTPQAVWWWDFYDLRPVLWVLVPTLVGIMLATARGELSGSALLNRRSVFLLVLWLCYNVSYMTGPYVDVLGPYRYTDPAWAISTLNKIFLLYFMACVCIDDEKKVKTLVGVVVISAAYLTYWANERYLSGGLIGRLSGPVDIYGRGIYSDENNFAMLFVVTVPFFWYVGHILKNRFLRWGLWLVIPFAWHAVFLTASRGGLVGLGAVTLLMVWRSKNRMFGFLLIPALVIAYFWQAGDLMKDRAATIDDTTETSSASRLQAWGAALHMIAAHPLNGVGIASFTTAFPDYSESKPREAHDTFFQISSESGLLAGTMYVLIASSVLLALWRNGKRLKGRKGDDDDEPRRQLYLINEAVLVSFSGLIVCSLFLSLQMFEIFWVLCLLTNAILHISRQKERAAAEALAGEQAPTPSPGAPRPGGRGAAAKGRGPGAKGRLAPPRVPTGASPHRR